MRYRLSGVRLCSLLLLGGGAVAQRGGGSYDAAKKFTVTSTVQRVDWQNPHVTLVVNQGQKAWDAVLAPPFRMTARGLEPDMIKPGTTVAVEGYPSTRVDNELRAERIVVGGKTFELR